ncbi:MAG: hypothetical protein ACJAQT_004543 [Akkermansiaceae bacterium]|jgi:hypothetical protein
MLPGFAKTEVIDKVAPKFESLPVSDQIGRLSRIIILGKNRSFIESLSPSLQKTQPENGFHDDSVEIRPQSSDGNLEMRPDIEVVRNNSVRPKAYP